MIARKGDNAVIASPKVFSTTGELPILSETDIKALTVRAKTRFHERLVGRVMERCSAKGYQFERERASHISKQVMSEMEDHKPNDVPKMKDYEKLTIVLLMMHRDATEAILSGPVVRNRHLPWAKRVDVVAKSYLTGLRRMNGQEVI
ncbi:hypothetical protein AADZ90_017045 [Aestuariibius sp. 2305UL40-4]|uniref:hypothetical protein n=1 Tax=Aestuariibius violaceus TaxID=3234132 RepID=UPI0034771611